MLERLTPNTKKSTGIAGVLAFFFGPIGALYLGRKVALASLAWFAAYYVIYQGVGTFQYRTTGEFAFGSLLWLAAPIVNTIAAVNIATLTQHRATNEETTPNAASAPGVENGAVGTASVSVEAQTRTKAPIETNAKVILGVLAFAVVVSATYLLTVVTQGQAAPTSNDVYSMSTAILQQVTPETKDNVCQSWAVAELRGSILDALQTDLEMNGLQVTDADHKTMAAALDTNC